MSERIIEGVRLCNPGRILYPEQGITRSDLADHTVAVAPFMLPPVAMRPITMVRCPTGARIRGPGWPGSGSAFQNFLPRKP